MPVAQEIQTSTEFSTLIETVKQAVVDVAKAELVPPLPATEGERVPMIKNRLIYDKNRETWAAKLRSDRHTVSIAGNPEKKIHCYMISYGGIADYADRTVGMMPFALLFRVVGYYQDDVGVDGDNAEESMAFELGKLAYSYQNTPKLNLPGVVKRVTGYRERRDPAKIGEVQVIESVIEFFVELQTVPKRNQNP